MENMNDAFPIILINFAIWACLAGLLLYFIIKRSKDKQNEDFEDRDN